MVYSMYEIVLYTDAHGYCPIETFIHSLDEAAQKNKNERIQLKQIKMYINILKLNGTRASEEIVEHIKDNVWQLRPGCNRILFAVDNNTCVLLHSFRKKSRKTPRREIEQAYRELNDWVNRNGHQ